MITTEQVNNYNCECGGTTYEIGIELLKNGKTIEHIEHEIEKDLKVAKDIYNNWEITNEQAKYLKKIDTKGEEIILLSENYITNILDIYNKTYDYDDMKIAIDCETFFQLNKDKIKKDDRHNFLNFEDIVCLAVEIKSNWNIDNEIGNLSELETAYIQEYTKKYLQEKYLGD